MIPGINDAHNHIDLHPVNEVDVDLPSMNPAWADAKAAITAAAAKSPAKSLLAATVGLKVWGDVSINRDSLDQLAPNNPVLLVTLTGHGFILNTAAAESSG